MTHSPINPYESPESVKRDAGVASVSKLRRNRGQLVVIALGTIIGAITCYTLLPIQYDYSLDGLLSRQTLSGTLVSVVVGGLIGATLAKLITAAFRPNRQVDMSTEGERSGSGSETVNPAHEG